MITIRGREVDFENYRFNFGKYNGELIEDVVRYDADYVLWCVENISWFALTEDDLHIVKEYSEEQKLDYDYYTDADGYNIYGSMWDYI